MEGNPFGENLQRYIKDHKTTQEALADMLGVHVNTVSNWIRGKGKPRDIARVAAKLGMSVEQMYSTAHARTGEVLEEPQAPYNAKAADEQLSEKIDALSEQMEQLIRMVSSLGGTSSEPSGRKE